MARYRRAWPELSPRTQSKGQKVKGKGQTVKDAQPFPFSFCLTRCLTRSLLPYAAAAFLAAAFSLAADRSSAVAV